MSSSKIDKNKNLIYDVTLASMIDDVIWGFNLSILEDDIFRTLERIQSNLAYFTTLL